MREHRSGAGEQRLLAHLGKTVVAAAQHGLRGGGIPGEQGNQRFVVRDGGVHRHSEVGHDGVAIGEQPARSCKVPSHRLEPGEVIEDQRAFTAMAAEPGANALATADRLLDGRRTDERR